MRTVRFGGRDSLVVEVLFFLVERFAEGLVRGGGGLEFEDGREFGEWVVVFGIGRLE